MTAVWRKVLESGQEVVFNGGYQKETYGKLVLPLVDFKVKEPKLDDMQDQVQKDIVARYTATGPVVLRGSDGSESLLFSEALFVRLFGNASEDHADCKKALSLVGAFWGLSPEAIDNELIGAFVDVAQQVIACIEQKEHALPAPNRVCSNQAVQKMRAQLQCSLKTFLLTSEPRTSAAFYKWIVQRDLDELYSQMHCQKNQPVQNWIQWGITQSSWGDFLTPLSELLSPEGTQMQTRDDQRLITLVLQPEQDGSRGLRIASSMLTALVHRSDVENTELYKRLKVAWNGTIQPTREGATLSLGRLQATILPPWLPAKGCPHGSSGTFSLLDNGDAEAVLNEKDIATAYKPSCLVLYGKQVLFADVLFVRMFCPESLDPKAYKEGLEKVGSVWGLHSEEIDDQLIGALGKVGRLVQEYVEKGHYGADSERAVRKNGAAKEIWEQLKKDIFEFGLDAWDHYSPGTDKSLDAFCKWIVERDLKKLQGKMGSVNTSEAQQICQCIAHNLKRPLAGALERQPIMQGMSPTTESEELTFTPGPSGLKIEPDFDT